MTAPNWHDLTGNEQQAVIHHALLAVLRTLRSELPREWLQHISFGTMCWMTADPTKCTARFTDHTVATAPNDIEISARIALQALLQSMDAGIKETVMDPR
jgi:hypothetical protein